jgi:hypothetical protein
MKSKKNPQIAGKGHNELCDFSNPVKQYASVCSSLDKPGPQTKPKRLRVDSFQGTGVPRQAPLHVVRSAK